MSKIKHLLTSAMTNQWKLPYPHLLWKHGAGLRRVALEYRPTQVQISWALGPTASLLQASLWGRHQYDQSHEYLGRLSKKMLKDAFYL